MASEQTLFVYKEVDLFKIPPRPAAGGHRSGDWLVADKIFTARCKVVAQGESLEVRLEDPNSVELFGVCPIPRGQLHIAVEAATDSSRNFVLRLEDAATKRHAFIGMSFGDRSAAFDFNVALSDHEKRLVREAEFNKIASAPDPLAAAEKILPEAAAMYKHQDLSLKQGETIKIAVKRSGANAADGGSGGFLSRLGNLPQTSAAGVGIPKLMPLAPPPSGTSRMGPERPPSHISRHGSTHAASSTTSTREGGFQGQQPDFLGLDNPVAIPASRTEHSSAVPVSNTNAAFGQSQPLPLAGTHTLDQQQPQSETPAAEPGWATFE